MVGFSDKCDVSSTDAAGLLTCDLTGMTTEVYDFKLIFTSDEDRYTAVSGLVENTQAQIYGSGGFMGAFMLVMILMFIGLYSPEVSILLSLLGIMASFMIGAFTISVGGIVALIIAGALLMYKVGS